MGAATWLNMDEVLDFFTLANVDDIKSTAIQSQYSASPSINLLATGYQTRLDASDDIDMLWNSIFWIPSCQGVALDTWGRIVGIKRQFNSEAGQIIWDDDYYRFLIMYKALANITSAESVIMNYLLNLLFAESTYILDKQNMTIRVIFDFYPDDIQLAIFMAYGLFNRGGGVGYEWYRIKTDETFGFDDQELLPFNQGIFAPYRLTPGNPEPWYPEDGYF